MDRTQIRPITPGDIAEHQGDLDQIAEWHEARQLALKWWGPKAARLEVHFHGEYNDEGGTYYYPEEVTAYSADGEELEFDLTLPAWQERLQDADWEEFFEQDKETGQRYYNAEYDHHSFFEDEWDIFGGYEGYRKKFDLTNPPKALPAWFALDAA